jgi:hypothetical protein
MRGTLSLKCKTMPHHAAWFAVLREHGAGLDLRRSYLYYRSPALWSRHLDSDQGPPGYEPGTLPLRHTAVPV